MMFAKLCIACAQSSLGTARRAAGVNVPDQHVYKATPHGEQVAVATHYILCMKLSEASENSSKSQQNAAGGWRCRRRLYGFDG